MFAILLGLAQTLEKPALDEAAGTLTFSAVTLKPEVYAQLKGVIEYVLVNKGGKAYESVFEAAVDPLALHAGLVKLGVAPGKPARTEGKGFIPDLERQDLLVLAAKNLVALHHSDPTVLATNPSEPKDGYKVNKELLPREGTPVKIVFEAQK
jgi:hypothetical protein